LLRLGGFYCANAGKHEERQHQQRDKNEEQTPYRRHEYFIRINYVDYATAGGKKRSLKLQVFRERTA
jgi:hypothetical protein